MASALELLNSLDTSGVKLFDPSKAFEFYHRLSHSNITDFKSCPDVGSSPAFVRIVSLLSTPPLGMLLVKLLLT